jgi:hypothetical protein
MHPERRRLIVLLGLLAVILLIAIYRFWPAAAVPGSARANARPGTRRTGPSAVAAADVRLQSLNEARPQPTEETQRDLFRFKPKAPPPQPVRPAPAVDPGSATQSGPAPPPALAPISMRFIGLVESTGTAQKIAILSDGRGIYEGREGDIIEGRYRILKIGVESIEMAYLDGRGRQTIRLSGS